LSELTKTHLELDAIKRSFIPKFVVWPALVIALIVIDQNYIHLFSANPEVYQVMFLMSIVPIAANTVAYASFTKVEPQRAAFIVFSSTVFAIAYIPIMISFVLPLIIRS